MANVTQYSVLFYGSSDGIRVTEHKFSSVMERPCSAGLDFTTRYAVSCGQSVRRIHNHASAFRNVRECDDVLRNEKPLNYYFAASRAFFGTSSEPVGEEE